MFQISAELYERLETIIHHQNKVLLNLIAKEKGWNTEELINKFLK